MREAVRALCVGLIWGAITSICAAAAPTAMETLTAFDRLAAQPLWPGFDPSKTPLAIYDGERTWLFRHPDPPAEFTRVDDGVWVFQGLHASVRANTSVDLNGATTATLMLSSAAEQRDGPDAAARAASVAIHEAFHVHQGSHGDWPTANETALFTYPVENAEALALRRLETAALTRALEADDDAQAASWAKAFVDARAERFGLLPEASAEYERRLEGYEGVAQFVERAALGRAAAVKGLAPRPPDAVRSRAYASGQAIAALLERFDPGWKAAFERDPGAFLDAALAGALERFQNSAAQTPADARQRALRDAERDIAELKVKLAERLQAFEALEGWSVEVIAPPERRLWPQGFDPLNVTRLGDVRVLHNRYLKAGDERGWIESLNAAALTEGFGPHPLYNGVRRMIVRGLKQAPSLKRENSGVSLLGEGVNARFENAEASQTGKRITIHLLP